MAEVKKTTTKKATTTKSAVKSSTTKAAPKAVKETVKEVKAETVAKKPAKKAGKQVKVTLVKSPIGYNKKQARVVKALGLNKMNSSHILPDNACVRGMVNTVSHLVRLEELN